MMSLEHGSRWGDDEPMTYSTSPARHDLTTHRRMREAMGPGYQVAIFRETAPLASRRRPTRR